MSYYCTLADARRELKVPPASLGGDSALFGYIRYASRRIDQYMMPRKRRPFFEPYIETRNYLVSQRNVSSNDNTLYFNEALLSFTDLDIAGTTITTQAVQYPPVDTPFYHLRLTSYSNSWYGYCSSDGSPSRLSITGTWGYNSDYDNAWLATGALSTGINDSVTSFDVGAGEGALFSPGMLLRVESEFMRLLSVTIDTLTVTRGANGSTASAHDSADSVDVWQVEPDVQHVVARQAGLLGARVGAFDSATIDALGVTQYPSDLLTELRAVVTAYQF